MPSSSITKNFIRYVAQSIAGMLGLSCYILADTFFITRGVGETGLTALNLAIPVFSLITGVGLMTGVGGATLIILRQDKSVFTHAVYIDAAVSVLFMLCGACFSRPLAFLLGADSLTAADTSVYLRTILLFAPFFLANNLLSAFVRSDGSPHLAMTAQLAGSFSNIVLDYIFIYPLGWGMAGAAFATCLAPVIGLGILSLHFLRRKNTFALIRTAPSVKISARICTLGLSSLITEFSSAVVIIVFNILLLHLAGNTAVAAYGIIANIALVVTSVFTGIAQGMQPLVGNCRRNCDRNGLCRLLMLGLSLSVITSIAVYAVSYACTAPIVEIFNSEKSAELAELACRGIRIYFTSYFACGISIITAASLSAADCPKHALVLSTLRGFVLLIPAALFLAACFGIDGVWMSVPVTEAVCGGLAVVFLRTMLQ